VEDGIVVAGLPVLVSDQVDANTLFWGIPKQHVMFVQRKDTTVERFPAVQQDGTYIRAVSRIGGLPERDRCGSRARRRVTRCTASEER
jgi:hypothetical protein